MLQDWWSRYPAAAGDSMLSQNLFLITRIDRCTPIGFRCNKINYTIEELVDDSAKTQAVLVDVKTSKVLTF